MSEIKYTKEYLKEAFRTGDMIANGEGTTYVRFPQEWFVKKEGEPYFEKIPLHDAITEHLNKSLRDFDEREEDLEGEPWIYTDKKEKS